MARTAGEDAMTPAGSRLWDRLCRFSLSRRRISREGLSRFCEGLATTERTLVVHSNDVDHRRYFPNSFVVSKNPSSSADLHTDRHYRGLDEIPDSSFPVILCTGLLEHVPDPDRLVGQFHRILAPGGRLILSASAVFPFHGSPENYFHFTPDGLRVLFRGWSRFEALRGSSRPFETIAILLQRINIQCDVFPPVRLLIEILCLVVPLLDAFVLRQYPRHSDRRREAAVDSIMPATLHAVVVR
jgi:SAM-dependent methyltransferase